MAKKVVFKDTAKGRAIRTTYQTLVAYLPLVLGVLTLPEVRDFVEGSTTGTVGVVALLAGVVSYVQNSRNK